LRDLPGFWDRSELRDASVAGDPIALVESLPDGDALVVGRVGGTTTYRLAAREVSLAAFAGSHAFNDPSANPTTPTLWTVDDEGRPLSVRCADEPFAAWDAITFADWGPRSP
jgi:hypothetical protein